MPAGTAPRILSEVLIPISSRSAPILTAFAFRLHRESGCRLHFLHVDLEPRGTAPRPEYLGMLDSRAGQAGVPIKIIERAGDPVAVTCAVASSIPASLVVVLGSRKGPITQKLLDGLESPTSPLGSQHLVLLVPEHPLRLSDFDTGRGT